MRLRLLPAAVFAALLAGVAMADTDGAQVKARVALAIARFVEIPGRDASAPLRLCLAVHGTPPRPLLALADEKVGAHAVVVRVGPPFDACDVIYLHDSFVQWRPFLEATRPAALTVGEMPGFLAAGGMVELVIDSDAVRFDVNMRALRSRNIRLPAQVLKLARQVKE